MLCAGSGLEPVLELEPLHQKILHVGRCTAQVHAAFKEYATSGELRRVAGSLSLD